MPGMQQSHMMSHVPQGSQHETCSDSYSESRSHSIKRKDKKGRTTRRSRSRRHRRSRSTSRGRGSARKERKHKKENKDSSPDQQGESDGDADSECNDKKCLGKYVFLGSGKGTSSYPRNQRVRIIRACADAHAGSKGLLAPVRCTTLTDESVDRVLYIATGCPPFVKMKEFKALKTRGALKASLIDESQRLQHRLQYVFPDFSNLIEMSEVMGFSKSPNTGKDKERERDADKKHVEKEKAKALTASSTVQVTDEQRAKYHEYWTKFKQPTGLAKKFGGGGC